MLTICVPISKCETFDALLDKFKTSVINTMSADTVAKSMGHHAHWGFSAGFDFIEALCNANSNHNYDPAVPINI